MFENCFPNTLDTTVHYRLLDGKPDTFVYTGDIHAMGYVIPVHKFGHTYNWHIKTLN